MGSLPHPQGPGDSVRLFGRDLDGGEPPLVVAELSANHRQDLALALESVRAAADSGADAVKFQHFTPNGLTVDGDHPDFRVSSGSLWADRTLHDLYSEAMMPWEWTEALVNEANSAGISWLSSPFEFEAVDFLLSMGVEALKIASFELVDLPLIRRAARSGLPIVVSTGMASIDEIGDAVSAIRGEGNEQVVLLRCNSSYPAEASEMDLMTISEMKSRWHVPVGLSDHTTTSTSSVVATSLGACLIEKHFTLDRKLGGPDGAFSLNPSEFAELVRSVHEAHAVLGGVRYGPSKSEVGSLQFRRSLRALRDIEVGDRFSSSNVGSRRPSGGLKPDAFSDLDGRPSRRRIPKGGPILAQDVGLIE